MPSGIYDHKKLKEFWKSWSRWSRKYPRCQKCGTTKIRHHSKGLCQKCYSAEYLQSDTYKNYYEKSKYCRWSKHTLRGHRLHGYIIDISINELEEIAKIATHCPICGRELSWNNSKLLPNSPSLDRKNNGKIIDKSSIWIICHLCNATKQNRTFKQFIEYCEMVSQKFIGK